MFDSSIADLQRIASYAVKTLDITGSSLSHSFGSSIVPRRDDASGSGGVKLFLAAIDIQDS
jgi:hypothetical protein